MYLHGLRGWRPLNGRPGLLRACGCLAVRLARVCGLSLQPIGCSLALACDVQRFCSCSCRLWRYISVMPLPYLLPQHHVARRNTSHVGQAPVGAESKVEDSTYTAPQVNKLDCIGS